jgi:hypothetical protein
MSRWLEKLRCASVVRFISSNVVRHVPEISFRRFFQQGDGSSTGEVSFSKCVPRLIISTVILSIIFLLLGFDPSAVFVAVGVSALGFSVAVYLLSKRFGKIPERGLDAAVFAYFSSTGWQSYVARDLLLAIRGSQQPLWLSWRFSPSTCRMSSLSSGSAKRREIPSAEAES